jgi:nucleotide-binding universal stress UspA family protein
LGSVAHTVVRAAPCPVLVVGEDRPLRPARRVLAAVDLSAVSASVLEHAIRFARTSSAEVRVLSAYDLLWVPPTWMESAPIPLNDADRAALMEKHRTAVDGLIERLRDPEVTVSSTVIPAHPPSKVILDQAQKIDADLIVLGASGHSAWQRFFLGSTATRVLPHAHCPVLVVPIIAPLPRVS